jgi:cytochrome c oxidase assembly protein subunit 11
VHFEATASDDLKWKFTPQQRFVKVLPGETALAFYTAENWGTEDVVGIATYNITPSRVRHLPLPFLNSDMLSHFTLPFFLHR